MRKLASIQKIQMIKSIPGADNIELAIVNNWQSVIKKGEFTIGDLIVYCEIDSFLPIVEKYEFLRKSSYKKIGDLEGFRLKTIKLRGCLSQGLILPLNVLEGLIDKDFTMQNSTMESIINDSWLGVDVTNLLGIIKYEAPIPANLAGKMRGLFPSFIPKTDEERIQNLTSFYNEYKKQHFFVTEKLDGSSMTCYYNNGSFGVCSRNIDLLETEENSFWKVARDYKIEEKLKTLGFNVAIQGELIGEGIQGNPYNIKGQSFRAFNIFDIDNQCYLNMEEFQKTCFDLSIQIVPIIFKSFELPETIDELLQYSEGKSTLNPNAEREGFVYRNYDRTLSFKVISNRFLLKEND